MYWKELRHTIRTWIGLHPRLFYNTVGLKHRDCVVRRDTEIVIEGYPRSANTYATLAFLYAQERDVKIGHHLHVPAQIMRAVNWKIPAIVLIRHPRDAVLSLLVRYPYAGTERCLREYRMFYEAIYELRNNFVVVDFEQTTSGLSRAVERINQRFGTGFLPFVNTSDNRAAVFERIDAVHKEAGRGSAQIAKPTEEKEQLKRNVLNRLNEGNSASLLAEAENWYRRYLELSEA